MGRNKTRKNEKLPKYCYANRGYIIYREYLGKIDGKYRHAPDIVLCKADAPQSEIWSAYEQVTGKSTVSLRWLVNKYLSSIQFKSLKPRTRKDYEGYSDKILNRKIGGGKQFGDVQYSAVKRPTIRHYLDTYPAKIAANRHIQFLKSVYYWGMERYETVTDNPCAKVKLNPQTPRTRFVTDDEYTLVLKAANESSYPYIPVFMELAVLCRARRSEISAYKMADILPEGLRLIRGKGSEGEITTWTPRLREVVQTAQRLHAGAPAPITGGYLVHDKKGLSIKKNAFDSAWRRVMAKAKSMGLKESFTFHDLKARGYSLMKEQYAGHKSAAMHKVYNRKLREVEATE